MPLIDRALKVGLSRPLLVKIASEGSIAFRESRGLYWSFGTGRAAEADTDQSKS
jgi:hypothetical protein